MARTNLGEGNYMLHSRHLDVKYKTCYVVKAIWGQDFQLKAWKVLYMDIEEFGSVTDEGFVGEIDWKRVEMNGTPYPVANAKLLLPFLPIELYKEEQAQQTK